MRTQLRNGILAIFLAVPVLAVAQSGPSRISPIDAPANAPDGGLTCPNGGASVVSQAPNQANGVFNDADCDFCAGPAQSIAEDFTLLDDTTVNQLVIWSGFFPSNLVNLSEPFTVNFFANAGGLPGAAISSETVVPTGSLTGVVLFGVQEVEFVLDLTPVDLPAGSYFVEVFADTSGSTDSTFWEFGNTDPIAGGEAQVFAFEAPGVTWMPLGSGAGLAMNLCGDPNADPLDVARFFVSKEFDDNNEASVEVTLSCNTGLPLEQTTTIEEGDPVNFVIGDFEQGALNCEVTEAPVTGYTTSYEDNDANVSADSCSWTGLVGAQYSCAITNSLEQSEVEVTKEWIDENPAFNPVNVAEATWSCSNVAFGNDDGGLDFFGNPSTQSFFVYPDWENGTVCNITEVFLPDGGVEVDDSNCQGITLFPGDSGSCTIVNTRLYEGIPTLSQYGLAVLALLMLGMGFVGFRRFV